MTSLWIAKLDDKNPPTWEIINSVSRQTIAYGMSKQDAEMFCKQRNKKQNK